jgi:hypothetical protein
MNCQTIFKRFQSQTIIGQFFLTIPFELEEAAIIDGCGYWKRFFHVILPLCIPALTTLAIFTLMTQWNDFLYPMIFLNNELNRTLVLGLAIFRGDVDTRLNPTSRPAWFFEREKYGGILCDIGSHQIEQYLYFADVKDAQVVRSQVANYNHPEYPEFEDFGEAMLVGDNGATNYFRVDWFTPDGLSAWGDGRTIILGTEGYIELRKYVDIGRDTRGDHIFLVNGSGEKHFNINGQVGYPFFGELILDCLNGTEKAMTQAHAFKAAELCLKAQQQAVVIR